MTEDDQAVHEFSIPADEWNRICDDGRLGEFTWLMHHECAPADTLRAWLIWNGYHYLEPYELDGGKPA